ncbi:MAG TPA: HNH endonuclease [Kofleriaceae bacterium]|nr:HNH endonuclease [Kofleriaceae bacterium]
MFDRFKRTPGAGSIGGGGISIAPGKRTLTASLSTAAPRSGAAHATPPKRVADGNDQNPAKRAEPNAVIKVVAYSKGKLIGQPFGAKARWEGPLPQRYTGTRSAAGWTWDSPDAKTVRIGSDLQGQGGKTLEEWAGANADQIVVYAAALDTVTNAKGAAPDERAPGQATDARDASDASATSASPAGRSPGDAASTNASDTRGHGHRAVGAPEATGELLADSDRAAVGEDLDAGIEQLVEAEAGSADDGDDDIGGAHHGRTGDDTRIGGTGPGGDRARGDGDGEGSDDGGSGGTAEGSRDGGERGASDGMYGGEGKPGDTGIPSGSGVIGIIGVPAALRGAVEVALIASDGNITGAGSGLFKQGLGKITSAVAARKMIASQARVTASKETKAALKQIATNPKTAAAWKAASKEERAAVTRRLYWGMQRRYFDAYLAAAKQAKREATTALKRSAKDVASRQKLAAAEMAEEAATVKPVAGRLPQNHELAGKQFPADLLSAQYRSKGVKFTPEGYPDFRPHAKQLPNGKSHVEIEYTGSRDADEALANAKAGLSSTPLDCTWHHVEDGKTMILVSRKLHRVVKHTGGTATYKHATGIGRYGN